jgi:hypothetical protein
MASSWVGLREEIAAHKKSTHCIKLLHLHFVIWRVLKPMVQRTYRESERLAPLIWLFARHQIPSKLSGKSEKMKFKLAKFKKLKSDWPQHLNVKNERLCPTSGTGYEIVYYDRMGTCPRRTHPICLQRPPPRRLQHLLTIHYGCVLLGQVPQRGGGVVVMRVILAKKCRKMH